MTFLNGPPPDSRLMRERAAQERPGRIEYLYLTEEQKRVNDEMNEAIDNLPPSVRLRCRTPEIRTVGEKEIPYFEHIDYDERTPPSVEEADLMCRTAGVMCPVREQCLRLGRALNADLGVWGGRTFVDGYEYHHRN